MTKNDISKKLKHFWSKYTFSIMIFIVVALYLCSWVCINLNYSSSSDRGTFGDQFGAVNALFSGLAFAGLIYTIILQRSELELQREELRMTRQEMHNQTNEFEKENSTFQYQRFENTFFNLLNQFESVTNQLTFQFHTGKKTTIIGRELFRSAFEDVPHYIDEGNAPVNGMRKLLEQKGMEGYVESFTPTYFDHYFRLLYRIVKFVDESKLIQEKDKYEYVCILRALLSRYELVWLYYNGLSEYGCEKMKPYIEKYALLKNIREDLLLEDFAMENKYSDGAFRHIIEES